MRAPKTYKFRVSGRGVFPYDMLRYDRCYPALESEVGRMGCAVDGEQRSVTLLGPAYPTVGRWESFGWTVVVQEVIKS